MAYNQNTVGTHNQAPFIMHYSLSSSQRFRSDGEVASACHKPRKVCGNHQIAVERTRHNSTSNTRRGVFLHRCRTQGGAVGRSITYSLDPRDVRIKHHNQVGNMICWRRCVLCTELWRNWRETGRSELNHALHSLGRKPRLAFEPTANT